MNNSIAKWLVRAGSLLIVLGFFIPSVAVSCTAIPGASQSFSMNDLATQANQPILYLVLLGAIASLIVALIPPRDSGQNFLFLIGQIAGFGIGVFSIFVTILSLSSQMQQAGFEVNIGVGFIVLLLGYGLGGIGIIMDFLQSGRSLLRPKYSPPPPGLMPEPPPGTYSAVPAALGARLEVLRGNAPSPVYIQNTDFQIGRSSRNHLVLNDRQVSGTHARLRFAQGAWFLQDQNSSNGTFVNGKPVKAQRLNDGDQIRIGETTFVIHL